MGNERIAIVYQPRVAMVTYPSIFPNRYTVSDNGIVTDLHPRIPNSWQVIYSNYPKVLHPFLNRSSNKLFVHIKTNENKTHQISIARLVAWEFVSENRDFNNKVIFKDGNLHNLHYTNLIWISKAKYIALRRKEKKFNFDTYQDKTNHELLKIQQMFTF